MSDAIVECCVDTIVEDCWPALWQHSRLLCCLVTTAAALLAVAVGLVVAFGTAHPVAATVKAASLSRLSAAADNNTNYYALSLTVALRNPNVALGAIHSAALSGGISVAGSRFGGGGGGDAFQIADAGQEIRAKEKAEYRVEATGEVTPDGGTKMVQVELGIAGEVTYRPFHRGRHAMTAMCTMQLMPLPPPPGFTVVAPVFQPVKCVPVKSGF
ncbi:unnamed protein product [Urochloa humidicola]